MAINVYQDREQVRGASSQREVFDYHTYFFDPETGQLTRRTQRRIEDLDGNSKPVEWDEGEPIEKVVRLEDLPTAVREHITIMLSPIVRK